MTRHLSEAVNEEIGHAGRLYHRLVLVEEPAKVRVVLE